MRASFSPALRTVHLAHLACHASAMSNLHPETSCIGDVPVGVHAAFPTRPPLVGNPLTRQPCRLRGSLRRENAIRHHVLASLLGASWGLGKAWGFFLFVWCACLQLRRVLTIHCACFCLLFVAYGGDELEGGLWWRLPAFWSCVTCYGRCLFCF